MDIMVDNQGVGGMTTTASLPLLKHWVQFDPTPSLVMVDFIVNDSVDPQEQGISSLVAAMELMVVQLGHIPVVFVATCAVESCHRVKTAISFVSAVHNAPMLSFADASAAASELLTNTPYGLVQEYWQFDDSDWRHTQLHPNWKTHQLIADMLAYAWKSASSGADCPTLPLSDISGNKDVYLCDSPVSFYSALDGSSATRMHNWALVEDVPGKPGWVTDTNEASSITFNVSFGQRPRLTVTYLRSYTGLGNVQMYFANDPVSDRKFNLPGLYESADAKASQNYLHVFPVYKDEFMDKDGSSGIVGFGIKPLSTWELVFETEAGGGTPDQWDEDRGLTRGRNFRKFKIISVSTC